MTAEMDNSHYCTCMLVKIKGALAELLWNLKVMSASQTAGDIHTQTAVHQEHHTGVVVFVKLTIISVRRVPLDIHQTLKNVRKML